jgi:hypothetical protein
MIKNFLFVLKRFKTSSILNILGLSVAFAVFPITMIQCWYDFGYNRNFKNARDIYQFSDLWEVFEMQTVGISIPLAHAITDRFPEVKACCILRTSENKLFKSQASSETLFSFRLMNTNEAFLDVFMPKILAGDAKPAFTEKNKAMLTADIAEILFGKEDPIGQMIWQDTIPYTVTAICEPFPENCSLKNGVYTTILGANISQTLDFLRKTWKKISGEPFDLHFLDAQLDSLYQSERNLARLISIFGIIAVIIAVMGVYGLIVFNARHKAKEIAIYKVNGSTITEIMLMLNRNMLIQFCIAFVVAIPTAYYIIAGWLENFAYKTVIHWWVFLLGGLIVLIITLFTVRVRSY